MKSEDSFQQDEDDEEQHWEDGSPTSSLTKLASSLAQRVGLANGSSLTSERSSLPSDAELEAEASREREHSRREAERILTQEAEERRKVEERIRGLLSAKATTNPIQGVSPTTRAASLPAPPSPLSMGAVSSSPKEGGGWWANAKARLTPTKESLTPAQQIMQEA